MVIRGKTYYFVYGTTGHQILDKLTMAAVTGAISSFIIGGKATIVKGTIASIALAIINGGFGGYYYSRDTYYPLKNELYTDRQ